MGFIFTMYLYFMCLIYYCYLHLHIINYVNYLTYFQVVQRLVNS